MKLKGYRKRLLYVGLLLVLCVLIEGAILFLSFAPGFRDNTKNVFGVVTPTTIKGILQAFLCLFTILMVCLDRKVGGRFAIIILAFTVIFMTFSFIGATLNSPDHLAGLLMLPGVAYIFASLVSMELIIEKIKEVETKNITDHITGLYNRNGFVEECTKLIDSNRLQAVVLMVTKEVRNINDNLGHSYGDTVLHMVSERLKDLLGKSYILSRIDGNTFAIAIPKGSDVKKLCDNITAEITRKYTLLTFEGKKSSLDYYLNPFYGVSLYSEATNTISKMMQHADKAVYAAVNRKRDRVIFFSDDIDAEEAAQNETIRKIQESLDKDYFYSVYQPQYSAKDKKLRGFEALLRCKYKNEEDLFPAEFIPIAEKTNLILELDKYVLQRVMTEFGPLVANAKEKFVVSINVSAKSMASADFCEQLAKILKTTGFPAEYLELEITEYSFVEPDNYTFPNVMKLRDMQIKIALDDFGTGYTSLAQLLKLPVNILKIDKSLIDDVETSQVNMDFVDSVIYMGHLMKCEVVAEGVETSKQLEILQEHGCEFIQGFYWDKPLSVEEAKKKI